MVLEGTIKQASVGITLMLRLLFFIALVVLETQTEMWQVSEIRFPCETLDCHPKPRLKYSTQHLFGTHLVTFVRILTNPDINY
jgi:hypothetical protein